MLVASFTARRLFSPAETGTRIERTGRCARSLPSRPYPTRRRSLGLPGMRVQPEPLAPLANHPRRPQPGQLQLLSPDLLTQLGLVKLQFLNPPQVAGLLRTYRHHGNADDRQTDQHSHEPGHRHADACLDAWASDNGRR